MSGLQQVTNQELIRELETRIKTKKINEGEISQLLEIKKTKITRIWSGGQWPRGKWRVGGLENSGKWKLGCLKKS